MKKGTYYAHKTTCITINKEPTATDQSQARETDINVIVKRYTQHGQLPQGARQPIYGQDFTQLPNNLRDMIEASRKVTDLRKKLPEPLRKLTLAELMALTPQQLTDKLKPAEPPKPTEEQKP